MNQTIYLPIYGTKASVNHQKLLPVSLTRLIMAEQYGTKKAAIYANPITTSLSLIVYRPKRARAIKIFVKRNVQYSIRDILPLKLNAFFQPLLNILMRCMAIIYLRGRHGITA